MRLIDADALLKEIENEQKYLIARGQLSEEHILVHSLKRPVLDAPTVDAVERKKGKWTEKHHAYSDEESVIEEWQSCRCSECGRYDTRPYMYYFSEPNYCSYCGADMRGENDG